jgi:Dynein light intermediate chain (DLIC)
VIFYIHRSFAVAVVHGAASSFFTSKGVAPPYIGYHRLGLDSAMDIHRGITSMADLGRKVGERGRIARTGYCTGRMQGTMQVRCYFFQPLLIFFLVQYHLQHFAEPSNEPLPTTSTMSSTLLPLGPGMLTHNSSGVPIVVVCTKADLIDENNELAVGPSGMGGMVKGKGGEWEERTDTVMQVLRTICLKCENRKLISRCYFC